MKAPFFRSVTLIGMIGLLIPWVSFSADLPVAPFQARYEVYTHGISMGKAVMTLEATGVNTYQMRSDVEPNAIAALLVSSETRERVSGEIRDGEIQPTRYTRHVKTISKVKDVQLDFNWLAKQIKARYNEEQAILPLSSGVVDPLSLTMMVMRDLQHKRLPEQYVMADKTKLKTWQIRNLGEEKLDTPLGQLRAVQIKQFTPGKTRSTSFWFAPEFNYIPVQVVQHKKGKEEFRMEIREIESQP